MTYMRILHLQGEMPTKQRETDTLQRKDKIIEQCFNGETGRIGVLKNGKRKTALTPNECFDGGI